MKPQSILNHMPDHIKQQIVDHVDSFTKLSVRQCSKEYTSIVSKSPTTNEKLLVELKAQGNIKITLTLGEKEPRELQISRRFQGFGFLMRNEKLNWEKMVEDKDFVTGAVEFLIKLVGNQKVLVNKLSFVTFARSPDDQEYMNKFFEALDRAIIALNFKLRVNNVSFYL